MSALYGSIVGNRGMATRMGSVNSGIKGSVQSWNGSVITSMDLDKDYKPIVTIDITKDSSSSSWGGCEYFHGSLDELREALTDYKEKIKAKKLEGGK